MCEADARDDGLVETHWNVVVVVVEEVDDEVMAAVEILVMVGADLLAAETSSSTSSSSLSALCDKLISFALNEEFAFAGGNETSIAVSH